jgi:Concanavalin A-like lectin/glucanases superfamily
MSRKLIYLNSFVLVLGLLLTNVASAANSGLAGWWKLDGNAKDSSGNGHDGVLYGDPQWVGGRIGGALKFDGVDDRVEIPGTSEADGFPALSGEVTWTVWINTSASPTGSLTFMSQGPTGGAHVNGNRSICVEPSGQIMLRAFNVGVLTSFMSSAVVNDGQWHHVAVTIAFDTSGTNDTAKVYIDGDLSKGYTVDTVDINAQAAAGNSFIVTLGYRANSFDGLIDDARVYNRVLSETEIASVMTAKPWPYAYGPNPAEGSIQPDTWVTLKWSVGDFAVSHDAYLGDNFDDVNNGTGGTFQDNQDATLLVVGFPGYPYPDGLVPGTTYYWRIDEVNDAEPNSPWKGPVWRSGASRSCPGRLITPIHPTAPNL